MAGHLRSLPHRNYQIEQAILYTNLGTYYQKVTDLKNATKSYKKALLMYEELVKEEDSVKYYKFNAGVHNNLSNIYQSIGKNKEALDELDKSMTLLQALIDINYPGVISHFAGTLSNLGLLLKKGGNYQESEKKHILALKIYLALVDENPEVYEQELARVWSNLGNLYSSLEKFELSKTSH